VTVPLSEEYERQARELEDSATPLILKATRALAWAVYAVVLVKCALLVTSFVFQLLGANPDSSFASWVYRSADRSMDPFRGIFPTTELSDSSVLNLSLLFAAIVYLVLAMLVDAGLKWLGRKLSDRDRRIHELRSAARNARIQEYQAEQDLRVRQLTAQQQAGGTPQAPPSSGPSAV
jgi:uncharacterized protein YggT (Ycf19 family)